MGSNPLWLTQPTVGGFSVCLSHHDTSPRQVGLWGSLDAHSVYPPNTVFPQHTQGSTHQFRLHCSSQTPCTSLEITEQAKTGISLEAGSPLQGPSASLEGKWPGPHGAHTNFSPRGGVLTRVPSSQLLSPKKELTLPAPLSHRCHGERCPGGHSDPQPR